MVKLQPHNQWFVFGCFTELLLLGMAAVAGWIFDRPLLADFHWDIEDAWLGALATLPPLGLFFWMLGSRRRAFVEIREFLENAVAPIFRKWSLAQLAVISILAGVCEEIFFRGMVQGLLARAIGAAGAILAASALFGGFHLITWTYAAVTTLIGVYLGVIWHLSGNLLTPIVIHILYDFIALVYFLRIHRR